MTIALHFKTKADLVAALESRRAWVKALDKKAIAEHAKEEKKALIDFRAAVVKYRKQMLTHMSALAQISKRSYADIKALDNSSHFSTPHGFSTPRGFSTLHRERPSVPQMHQPRCPRSFEPKLDAAIAGVNMSTQERYTIRETGQYSTIHFLLTHDETAKVDVCQ